MIIYLIKENILKKFFLPLTIQGNYWISDIDNNGEEVNLINIEAEDSIWYFISNSNVYYVENNYKVLKKKIEEYNAYSLRMNKNYINLYCSPLNDKTFRYYNISNLNGMITIGSNNNNQIKYNINGIGEIGQITCKGSYLTINNISNNIAIYVNDVRIINEIVLKNGDTIFINGLRIIIFINKEITALIINNPQNLVTVSLKEMGKIEYKNEFNPEETTLDDFAGEQEYFHRKPRFIQIIKKYEVNIDPPPNPPSENKLPLLLTIGPMLTTSMMSLMYGYRAINTLQNNPDNKAQAIFPLVMSISMLSGTLLWPNLTKKYNKKKVKEYGILREKKYGEYIEKIKNQIEIEKQKQRQILLNNNPSLEDAKKTILENKINLWQRRTEDEDFLNINIGFGNIPMDISIKYPEEHFTMEEDELKRLVIKVGSEEKILNEVPIIFQLRESKLLSLIGNNRIIAEYMKTIMLQLIAYHSYEDLKIIILTDENKKSYWNLFKTLPHCWNDKKTFRYYGTNKEEYKEMTLDIILGGDHKKE